MISLFKFELFKLNLGILFFLLKFFKFFGDCKFLRWVFDNLFSVIIIKLFKFEIILLDYICLFILHKLYKWVFNQLVSFLKNLFFGLLLPQWFWETDLISFNLTWFNCLFVIPVHKFTGYELIFTAEVMVIDQFPVQKVTLVLCPLIEPHKFET